jgi:hypothetical protein
MFFAVAGALVAAVAVPQLAAAILLLMLALLVVGKLTGSRWP